MNPSDPTQQPQSTSPAVEALPTEPAQPVVLGGQASNPAAAPVTPPTPPEPTPVAPDTPTPPTTPETPAAPTPVEAPVADPASPAPPEEDVTILRWQGAERIDREKNTLWFVVLGVVVVVMMAIAIFLMRSPTFAILIPVMAVALVIYVRRPPATISYTLSTKGLYINDRLFPYSQFKSFGVVHGEEQYSIRLIPRKRFEMATSAYFPEEQGEQIVDALGARLPMEDVKLDAIDRLLRKLRV